MKLDFYLPAFGLVGNVIGASTFKPARPPAIPLAVRSPYMSTWLESGTDGGILPGASPRSWAGPQPGDVAGANGAVTGWTGMIKVDGDTYVWMGAPEPNGEKPTNVDQQSFEYTSTRSTFIMDVDGKVTMNVSFVSPVTPKDLQRQSVVGTYLEVLVTSSDGDEHDVQLYADTSAEWVNPTHNSDVAQWSYSDNDGIASHKSWRQAQSEFNADYADDAAHWGNWYWSTESTDSLTYQSGSDSEVRGNFATNGSLPNTQDSDYRAINSNFPVFGFATDLGNVGDRATSTVFTILLAQQNSIYFLSATGDVSVPSLWTSYFSSDADLVSFFYNDWENQDGSFDALVASESSAAGGDDYLTITSLSVRQAFAAVELCNTPDQPYLFLKEISSDGNVQTVDVIYPAHPIFLWSNPDLVKYLLDPLFENQESGKWPQTYTLHDLGSSYPQATGHSTGDGEVMPLEECGNMLIMTLAYAQRVSDGTTYLRQHYDILKQWTGYLIQEALYPANQLSTDDFQGELANQTDLALKGIIGIEAMAVIATLTENTADAKNFSDTAKSYIRQWQDLAVVDDTHTSLSYGNDTSHGLLYNLYADKLLGTNLVPQHIYDIQSDFYPTIANEYGVPLDTRNARTKSDWQIWCAAIASDTTKSMFISKIANWINTTPTNRALTDLYDTTTGAYPPTITFIARPVVGGHFALLALNDAPTSVQDKRMVAREFKA